MSEGFDPYYKWLGIGPEEQPANHYRLLGIRLLEPDPDVIQDAAYQRMAHVRTYQLGPRSAISQQILNELAAAKVCLLDPQKKAAYDSVLRSKIEAQASPRPPVEVYPDFTTPAPPRKLSPDRQTKRKQQAWMVPAIVAVGLLCLGLLAVLLWSGKKGEPHAEQRSIRREQAIAKAEGSRPLTDWLPNPRRSPRLRQQLKNRHLASLMQPLRLSLQRPRHPSRRLSLRLLQSKFRPLLRSLP